MTVDGAPPNPPSVQSGTAVLLDADAAAARLGVRRASLYAYVSRGWLTAVPDPADPRRSRYSSFELDLLASRQGGRRARVQQTLAAVSEGWPLLDTALSCIADGQPLYRGQRACDLATHASAEDVARLLWQCAPHDPFDAPAPTPPAPWRALADSLRRQPHEARTLALLGLALPALHGPAWLDAPEALARAAGAHLRMALACFLAREPDAQPLHEQLRAAWRLPRRAADPLRCALVLAADHEMNMIAFTGRALSSVGAPLGHALLGAMCTLGSSFSGGATGRVEALWDELTGARDLDAAVATRLRRDGALPGFNHLSYPAGDPRAVLLLAQARALSPLPPIADAVHAATGWQPSIDFGFVALRRALKAPPEAALTLQFAGRCVGVIGHVLEQRRSGQRIVTRARYVGPLP